MRLSVVCSLTFLASLTSGDLSKFLDEEDEEYDYYYDENNDDISGYNDGSPGQYKNKNLEEKPAGKGVATYGSKDINLNDRNFNSNDQQVYNGNNARDGSFKEDSEIFSPKGGIDFSGCTNDKETGQCCITKESQITGVRKDPILECSHRDTEQCHYTYVTQFRPSQEEICEETFEKQCSIAFNKKASNETVQKCYQPLVRVCGGGPDSLDNYIDDQQTYENKRRYKKDTKHNRNNRKCKTFFESSCTTRYVEKSPGKFVGDTSCEKLPIELCGEGCSMEPGQKECHEKTVVTVIDVPEEVCDLNPVKTCKFATKLVPHLSPMHECTSVPKEVCILKFTPPQEVQKPFLTKWCLDESDPVYNGGKGAKSNNNGEQKESNGNNNSRSSNDIYQAISSAEKRQQDLNNYSKENKKDANLSPRENYGSPNLDNYQTPSRSKTSNSKPKNEYKSPVEAPKVATAKNYLSPDSGLPDTFESADTSPTEQYGSPAISSNENYNSPDELSENYGSPRTVLQDDYGSPNTFPGNSYESPNTELIQSFESPDTIPNDNYGAPSSILEDNYQAPESDPGDRYGSPNAPLDANYASPEAPNGNYGSPNTEAGANYGSPSYAPNDEYGSPGEEPSKNYGSPNDESAENYKSLKDAPNELYDSPIQDSYESPNSSPINKYGSKNSAPAGNYESPSSSPGDLYDSTNVKPGESYDSPNAAAADNYGSPNNVAPGDNYGPPNVSTQDGYESPNPEPSDDYAAPGETYKGSNQLTAGGAPNSYIIQDRTVVDNYGAPDDDLEKYETTNTKLTDDYSSPSKVDTNAYNEGNKISGLEATDSYGAPESSPGSYSKNPSIRKNNEESIGNDLKTYGEGDTNDLAAYGSNQDQYSSKETNVKSAAQSYRIDNGFGKNPKRYYKERKDELRSYGDNSLGRYLTPPFGSRKSKSNGGFKKKKNRSKKRGRPYNNRIRSVDPNIY